MRLVRLVRILAVLLALAVPAVLGCTHVDVKGREHLRLGPLREVRAVPTGIDPLVTVDAGTDVFTDTELSDIEAALAPALEASFARLAREDGGDRSEGKPLLRIGSARVGACKLRAGPNERFVVYLAKCHVSLVVDGVVVAEATGEGLRRSESVFLRKAVPRAGGEERDPAVAFSESRAALIAALDAAARVLAEGPLPRAEGEAPMLPRPRRIALARARLQAATTTDEKIAALFDLRSVGVPADAALAAQHLDDVRSAVDSAGVRAGAAQRADDDPVDESPPRKAPVIGAAPEEAPAEAPAAADARAPADGANADRPPPGPVLDVAVVASAIDAIGELCAPSLAARVEAVPSLPDDAIGRAKARALSRLRACASIVR